MVLKTFSYDYLLVDNNSLKTAVCSILNSSHELSRYSILIQQYCEKNLFLIPTCQGLQHLFSLFTFYHQKFEKMKQRALPLHTPLKQCTNESVDPWTTNSIIPFIIYIFKKVIEFRRYFPYITSERLTKNPKI